MLDRAPPAWSSAACVVLRTSRSDQLLTACCQISTHHSCPYTRVFIRPASRVILWPDHVLAYWVMQLQVYAVGHFVPILVGNLSATAYLATHRLSIILDANYHGNVFRLLV